MKKIIITILIATLVCSMPIIGIYSFKTRVLDNTKIFTFYTITWKNLDGTILATDKVLYGRTPVYTGPRPSINTYLPKYSNLRNEFCGWQPEVRPVVCDTLYTAQYCGKMSG